MKVLSDFENYLYLSSKRATNNATWDLQTQMPLFVPRQRKHRVIQRLAHNDRKTEPTLDTNTIEILPASKREQEEKRNILRAELRGHQQKISSKKQKRLDKYIVNKQLW